MAAPDDRADPSAPAVRRLGCPRRRVAGLALLAAVGVGLATLLAQRPLPDSLTAPGSGDGPRLLTREGVPIFKGAVDGWNIDQQKRLEEVPALLREAFVLAEDRRFWRHGGPDWLARAAALRQNVVAGHAVRGASTISEQVVRMLHPRPRTLWSRWLEGFEAMRLEARFSKPQILEFYLNQVPYGANRHGVAQAADYYFGRELETFSAREMLCLAVLVRAPSALDPLRDLARSRGAIDRLAARMDAAGRLDATRLAASELQVRSGGGAQTTIWAPHFRRAALARMADSGAGAATLVTTLDGPLQRRVENLAYERLRDLSRLGVSDLAALVVELDGNRVRAWVSASLGARRVDGIDAVTAPRQPGSTLKPLLYAMAFDRGWTPETEIEDRRLAERVGHGQHVYSNYSRVHYGRVSVREALGNSLNIPAVLTLQFVGADRFLAGLRRLGMRSLSAHPNFYGDGLALGNGEVSLAELAQAYAAIGNGGRFRPLTLVEGLGPPGGDAVLSETASANIRAILADETSRYLEFGDGGVLRFQRDVAVKTGTSNDYHDAWTLAFDGSYLVAVWAGNLARRETDGVSGAIGPALLVRSIFAQLPAGEIQVAESAKAQTSPPLITDIKPDSREDAPLRWRQPFEGLVIATDPRVPMEYQQLKFEVVPEVPGRYLWSVDGLALGQTTEPSIDWPVTPGPHKAIVRFVNTGGIKREATVSFQVR